VTSSPQAEAVDAISGSQLENSCCCDVWYTLRLSDASLRLVVVAGSTEPEAILVQGLTTSTVVVLLVHATASGGTASALTALALRLVLLVLVQCRLLVAVVLVPTSECQCTTRSRTPSHGRASLSDVSQSLA
jgi:hypothetical protein